MKKTFALILSLMLLFGLTACGEKNKTAEMTDDGLMDHLSGGSYESEMYGNLWQVTKVDDTCYVAAIQPLTEGGVRYEGYPWETVYIPADLVPEEYQEKAFHFVLMPDANAGGFLSLPSIVMAMEEVEPADVPFWGGR